MDEPELFIGPEGQLKMFDKSPEQSTMEQERVECLGMTFESDDARRQHFLEKLREKLKNPEFRNGPDFPVGDDEDILRLSDPPYYTACPNPFLADFVRHCGRPYDPQEPYHREPFAVDPFCLKERKSHPLATISGPPPMPSVSFTPRPSTRSTSVLRSWRICWTRGSLWPCPSC